MNILIAPDKFKGSLPAREVCRAITKGIRNRYPGAIIQHHPLADGGDGTLSILHEHLDLETISVETVDPLGRPILGDYLLGEDVAFIEVATAAGLVLLTQEERNPLLTSTYGSGLMVADALKQGVSEIYLLLGGSATHDLGTGIARALGVRFLDKDGEDVAPNGRGLEQIQRILIPEKAQWIGKSITLLCDVSNPLVGQSGSAHVYAAQKGADKATIDRLERGSRHLGRLLDELAGADISNLPGGGAAGGIAAGLSALLGATLRSGFQTISELTGLESAVSRADYIITGEGQLDEQSLQGKVVGGVLELCSKFNKDCYVFTGRNQLANQQTLNQRLKKVFEIMSLAPDEQSAMNRAEDYLTELADSLDFSTNE